MFEQQKRRALTGKSEKERLPLAFGFSVRPELHGAKLTREGGLILYRELDKALGLTILAEEVLRFYGMTATAKHASHARHLPRPKSMIIWGAEGTVDDSQ